MKSIVAALLLWFLPFAVIGQATFSGEFRLKAKTSVEAMMLAPEYQVLVDGGNATLKFTRNGSPLESKGTASLTIRNGIDPTTKRPAKLIGFLRVEVIDSGWSRDKFVTRIDIPLEPTGEMRKATASPVPVPVLGFASTAAAEVLWLDVLSNGISRYSDPMGIRLQSEYGVEIIKDPLK